MIDTLMFETRVITNFNILNMASRKSSLASENYHFTSHYHRPTGNKSQDRALLRVKDISRKYLLRILWVKLKHCSASSALHK